MKLVKCPRCDLNYITENEKYCKICLREMKGSSAKEEVELCSICNEAPVLPGRDVCFFCLNEMNGDADRDANDPQDSGDNIDGGSDSGVMDEIMADIGDEMDAKEFGEIADELSLESVREDEENQDDDDDEKDDM